MECQNQPWYTQCEDACIIINARVRVLLSFSCTSSTYAYTYLSIQLHMHAHTHTHLSSTRLLWNMVLMWMQLIIKATHPFTCSAQRRGKWIPFLTPLQCWWGSTPYSAVQTSYISPNLIPKLQSCRPLLHTASDQKLELVKAWELDTCTRDLLVLYNSLQRRMNRNSFSSERHALPTTPIIVTACTC